MSKNQKYIAIMAVAVICGAISFMVMKVFQPVNTSGMILKVVALALLSAILIVVIVKAIKLMRAPD